MTDLRNHTVAWAAALLVASLLTAAQEGSYRDLASRLDAKIANNELVVAVLQSPQETRIKSAMIRRMNPQRNAARAKAEQYEVSYIAFGVASGLTIMATSATGYVFWALIACSGLGVALAIMALTVPGVVLWFLELDVVAVVMGTV